MIADMTRRALLVGSQTYGLTGCNADVALMRVTLTARGFDAIETLVDGDATRAGILDAFGRLATEIAAHDTVVVYYSGHGGRVTRPDFEARKRAGLSPFFHFLVPFDMADSRSGDFRGLLSEEVTQQQTRLTDAFRQLGADPNIATILDCCHAGHVARDAFATAKSIDLESKGFEMQGIRQHADELGRAAQQTGIATNADAVRLVACAPEQSAYEIASPRGGRHGAMTDALASTLEGLGDAQLGWSTLADLVRRRVQVVAPEQRPEVEGPADRFVFAEERLPDPSAMPLTIVDGVARIEAAALFGIAVGDEFALVEPGAAQPKGTAVVGSIVGGDAVLALSSDLGGIAPDSMLVAVPVRVSVPKIRIRLGFSGDPAASLQRRLDQTGWFETAVADVPTVASVVASGNGDRLAIVDSLGARWRRADYANDDAGHAAVVEVLEEVAVGQRLLSLPDGDGVRALGSSVEISFGVVEGDSLVAAPRPRQGAQLTTGDRVSLTLRNTSPEPVYLWVFDVGVSGRASLISNADPSGARLGDVGADDDAVSVWPSTGQPLFWPEDVPEDPAPYTGGAARPESFVIVLSDRRSDLGRLAGQRRDGDDVPQSDLDALLGEAQRGVREVRSADPRTGPVRHRVEQIRFLLLPAPAQGLD